MLMAGGCHVFMPTYSPAALLAMLRQHSVTAMIAVPAMLQDICALGSATPCHSVRRLLVGAGAVTPATVSQIARLMPNACIQAAYGLTEAASSVTFSTLVVPPHLAELQRPRAPLCGSTAHSASSWPRSDSHSTESPPAGAGASQCVGYPAPGVRIRLLRVAGDGADNSDVARSGPPEVRHPDPVL